MSEVATLIVLALAAAVWFGVLRPRLRGRASEQGGDGSRAAIPDGQRDRHDGDAADGDGSDGGGDGGGD